MSDYSYAELNYKQSKELFSDDQLWKKNFRKIFNMPIDPEYLKENAEKYNLSDSKNYVCFRGPLANEYAAMMTFSVEKANNSPQTKSLSDAKKIELAAKDFCQTLGIKFDVLKETQDISTLNINNLMKENREAKSLSDHGQTIESFDLNVESPLIFQNKATADIEKYYQNNKSYISEIKHSDYMVIQQLDSGKRSGREDMLTISFDTKEKNSNMDAKFNGSKDIYKPSLVNELELLALANIAENQREGKMRGAFPPINVDLESREVTFEAKNAREVGNLLTSIKDKIKEPIEIDGREDRFDRHLQEWVMKKLISEDPKRNNVFNLNDLINNHNSTITRSTIQFFQSVNEKIEDETLDREAEEKAKQYLRDADEKALKEQEEKVMMEERARQPYTYTKEGEKVLDEILMASAEFAGVTYLTGMALSLEQIEERKSEEHVERHTRTVEEKYDRDGDGEIEADEITTREETYEER